MITTYYIKKGEIKKVEDFFVFDIPNQSNEYVMKAVVEAGGKLEMRGKIIVNKKAVGTKTFLRQKVLLLGEGAQAVVVPELEILTDDVKVGHAASIGRVDEGQLFYLMSRGLTRAEAVELIVEAFLK